MIDKMKQFSILAALVVISSSFIPFVVCHGIIPADVSKLNQWIAENVKEFAAQNAANGPNAAGLDPVLATAEASPQVITVNQQGPGDFKTITDAVKSIPPENTKRVIIKIGPGEYKEKITIDPSRKFVTFFGDPSIPKIMYDATAAQCGTVNSSTVAVEADYFMAVNIEFVNSSPPPDARRFDQQAVALRVTGDKAAFHNCRFIGYQDTLCDFIGRHLFKDCYIEGTVDFIFGDGQSIYLNSTIKSVATGLSVITAHARQEVSGASGFAFVHCKIIGSGDTYLGRAWKFSPRVVFAYTFMGEHINDLGWLNGMTGEPTKNDKQVFYGEYQCSGPGAETTGRAKFAKILTDEEVQPFLSLNYLNGTSWVLHPPKV